MKRVLACMLALVLMVSMIPVSLVTAYASDVTSNNYTFTSIDGDSIYIKPSQSEVTVLVFGMCYSTNTTNLLNSIANSDWVDCDEIRTIFVDCSDEYRCSKTDVQNFSSTIEESNIVYCYDSSGGWETYDAVAYYCGNASGGAITLSPPMVVLLDENNNIKDVSQNVQSANSIINSILEFANIDYTKTTSLVNILGQENYDSAYEVLNQLNELREDLNLTSLTMDEKLLNAAMQRAAEISIYYSHTRPNGESPFTVLENTIGTLGENIAFGQTTPDSVMNGWTNSTGHYENMVNKDYQSVGIGCFQTSDGYLCWVQMFSSTSSDGVTKTGTQSVIKTIEISKSKMLLEADLSKESIIANGEDRSQLDVYLYHSDAQYGEFAKLDPSSFNYSSTNTSIANINDQGIITSQLNGSANVTATLKDDGDIYISKAITSSGGITVDLKYGADRFSFWEDIVGYVGDEIETLVVYTSTDGNIASLDISSSDSSVVEIGTIEIGNGEYITGENECIATIPLNLKAVGSSTVTVISPENLQVSINVEVVENTSDDITYKLEAYTAYPGSTIGTNQEVKVMFKLFGNSDVVSLDGYNLDIDNTNIVEFVESQKSDEYQIVTIKGVSQGTTDITFSDSENRATVSLSVTVDDNCNYYRCSAFPIPYASSGSIYVENYNCVENADGTHNITLDAYNATYAYGVVAVYDENGDFLKCKPLSPLSDGSGMEKVVNGFKYVWGDIKDIFDGDTSWYTKESNAQHTPITLENIPQNAEIIITADGNESMYPILYTGVGVFVQTVFAASSMDIKIDGQRASVQELVEAVIESVPTSAIQSATDELATLLLQGATNESTAAIYEMVFNMFANVGVNFGDIIKNTLAGIGYGAADALVTTAIPAYKVVVIVDQVLEIAWPITDYSYNCNRGKLEIHTTSHGIENYLSNSSITVSQQNNFGLNTILDAYLVTKNDELQKISELIDAPTDEYSVYNITLREDGVEVQPENVVEVKIPTKDKNVKVYRVEDDSSLTEMDATYVDGYMVFETEHFCYWLLAENSSETADELSFEFNESDNSYSVTGCSAVTSGKIIIPATYNGFPVRTIADSAFFETDIVSVEISDGITSIGNEAFEGCSSLLSVTIPDSVMSIGYGAFDGCTSLSSIIIPDSVTSIGGGAFGNCTNLTSITIGNGVTKINYETFCRCSNLTSVTIPDSVTSISWSAFSNCTKLASVIIGDGVTSIDSSAFRGCTNLVNIIVDENNTGYCSVDGVLFSKDCKGLVCYPIGKNDVSYAIPDGVISIGDDSFYGCTKLESVIIPDSVTSVGEDAFYNCTNLSSITLSDSITNIEDRAFENTTYYKNTNNWESDVLYIDNHLIKCKNTKTGDYTIKSGTKTIADYAFLDCTSLETVNIPDGIVTIGRNAFFNCNNITNIIIPDSVTNIGMSAFSQCVGITRVTIGNGVTSIGYEAFCGCIGLTSLIIPNSVTEIGAWAFEGCDNLVIYGYKNSIAQTYAEDWNLSFIAIENNDVLLGDINGDETIDAGDAVVISRYDAGFITLTAEQLEAGDVNGDGAVDAGDAVIISRYDAGLISQIGY